MGRWNREYDGPYGRVFVGVPYRSGMGTYFRDDGYLSHDPSSELLVERVFAAGKADDTRHHFAPHDGDRYDARCSCCWLNFGHTVASHEHSIQSAS